MIYPQFINRYITFTKHHLYSILLVKVKMSQYIVFFA